MNTDFSAINFFFHKETLDKIVDPHLKREHDGIWSFKWSKPKLPNGIIFKYNLRFIDVKLNKVR